MVSASDGDGANTGHDASSGHERPVSDSTGTPSEAVGTPSETVATPAEAVGTPAGTVGTPADAMGTSAGGVSTSVGAARSEDFGRIDADGTVYVRTADGERAVGSWQAGTPEEGLAHYARRYADLVTEVELIETRLASGTTDAAHVTASVRRIAEQLPTAAVVGDLDALSTRVERLSGTLSEHAEQEKADRAAARAKAIERKTELVVEAEQIAADSTQWKAAGERLRQILTEWKTIRGADRKTDSALWKRYAAARDSFGRRRGSHFAGLDAARKQVQTRKEELVTEAESLSTSTDWGPTANRLKQLMTEWKNAGRAPREAEDALWTRFRAAQDAFFSARGAVFNERDEQQRTNQREKEQLLAEVEKLDLSTNAAAAQAQLRKIQAKWDEIGRVPREAMHSLENRLRRATDRIQDAVDAEFRRGNPDANPILTQMRTQVAEAQQRLDRAKAAGDQRRIKEAEQALESKRRFLDLAEQAK